MVIDSYLGWLEEVAVEHSPADEQPRSIALRGKSWRPRRFGNGN